MKIDIISIFPEMFQGPFAHSIVKRAQESGFIQINIHNLRDFTTDKHRQVDDKPYGGGAGMVMMVEPIHQAVKRLQSTDTQVILTSAAAPAYTQQDAQRLSEYPHLIIICGHYEGVDQRVADHIAHAQYSIGPYVLTGGELPAMVMTDSIVRLIPGVLGNPNSLSEESYADMSQAESDVQLEYPQYTRPDSYNGWTVPPVLLSGNHQHIARWRKSKSTRNQRS